MHPVPLLTRRQAASGRLSGRLAPLPPARDVRAPALVCAVPEVPPTGWSALLAPPSHLLTSRVYLWLLAMCASAANPACHVHRVRLQDQLWLRHTRGRPPQCDEGLPFVFVCRWCCHQTTVPRKVRVHRRVRFEATAPGRHHRRVWGQNRIHSKHSEDRIDRVNDDLTGAITMVIDT